MRVELAGEAIGTHFERGLSQHPNINDSVHLVTESDLRRIYGHNGGDDAQISVGTLSSAGSRGEALFGQSRHKTLRHTRVHGIGQVNNRRQPSSIYGTS